MEQGRSPCIPARSAQAGRPLGSAPRFPRAPPQRSRSSGRDAPSARRAGPAPSAEIGKIDQDIYKYNTPGFTGCLSRVQFNQIAPLKAALRPTNASSHVHIQGELVESNCGASPLTIPPMSAATDPWHLDSASADFPYNGQAIGDGVNRNSAIIGGVIAVVIFTILCTLVFLIRYMFRHKGTYHTNEAKGAESAESADAAIMNNDPNFTETIDESKKEWLI
ncbi:contactin-associated protein-like 2 [Malurus melanocephalus]|uniref:contactin-associated protein-like 2 n=1 Tax=Malurus melanocephalus TaxID=175006 RepID=UPI00254789C9|nr:contactin-associated protein-like 2 [Malurus melanocephalus]